MPVTFGGWSTTENASASFFVTPFSTHTSGLNSPDFFHWAYMRASTSFMSYRGSMEVIIWDFERIFYVGKIRGEVGQ